MKKIFIHIIGLILLMPFISCSDSEMMEQDMSNFQKRIPVTFSTTIPLLELPSSRTITDDSAINSYAIWVFSGGLFYEAIYPDDTYNGQSMVTLSNDGTLKVLLPDGLNNAMLAMVANVSDIKSYEPKSGTTLEAANAPFSGTDISNMPMYGTTDDSFTVSYGVNGGHITLYRAMAKVEVRASGARDHFELKEMRVYQTNSSGQVKEVSPIINGSEMTDFITIVDVTNNSASVYLPEVKIERENDKAKTFVLIKGTLAGVGDRWFKLDFIKQQESSNQITYHYLESLLRNHCYVFDIQYLTQGVSYEKPEDAIAAEASNKIIGESTELIVVIDQHIMDITTNNYIYLGVTAGNVSTTEGDNSYHVANISIVTNSEKGWSFESLPEGVEVSIEKYKPLDSIVEVISVWVYLDKNKYKSGSSETIYVYGDNIRKSIKITVP